jgi:large subunit ribosomal protein L16
MFEMAGPAEDVAKEAMRLAMHKLPIRCKFVTREQLEAEAKEVATKAEAVEAPVEAAE